MGLLYSNGMALKTTIVELVYDEQQIDKRDMLNQLRDLGVEVNEIDLARLQELYDTMTKGRVNRV